MIIPLAIVLGFQSQQSAASTLDRDFTKAETAYSAELERKASDSHDPKVRISSEHSKKFEAIALKAGNSPTALKAWMLALAACEPSLVHENKLIDHIVTLKATTEGEQAFISRWGQVYSKFVEAFESRNRLPKIYDPFLAGSKSKETTASLLLMKANTMSDILDIKWDVYNRLVEQYAGTGAAKEARTIILRKKHLQPGDLFPDFVSKDSDGKRFQLTEYRGKVVVLEFWANWCPSCQRTIPIMQGVEKEFAGQNVEFVGVNSDGAASVVKELEAKYNITHRNLADGSPSGPISIAYNIMAWPSFFVIGKDGKVVFRSAGIDADGMTKAILEALK